MAIKDRLIHAWNAFRDNEPQIGGGVASYSYRPDRIRLRIGNERSIISSVYNRIAIDVAAMKFRHVRVDENENYVEDIKSGLQECLNLAANIDQTGRSFIQDVVMSMFDEGCVAIVPVDTTIDPRNSNSYEINSLRTGKVLEWFPDKVRLRVYNDKKGEKEDILLQKKMVAIIENPLYSVMNEPNSTLQRLIHKLNLLDAIDEQSGSGKLDLIIQLPYTIKSEARQNQAEERRKKIETQLAGSKYGIAYVDATEKVTQLNRAVDNNLMNQIQYLTSMLYGQLGLTDEVFTGKADEQTMLNYYNRTVEPIASAIVDNMRKTFLTKTAITQGQSIMFFRDAFKLVPVNNIADIADKFTRNEILTSNEFRAIIGFRPSNDPNADVLLNKNINHPEEQPEQDELPTDQEFYNEEVEY